MGEEAKRLKAQYLHGKHGSRCGGHKRERVCEIPGEIWMLAVAKEVNEAIDVVRR